MNVLTKAKQPHLLLFFVLFLSGCGTVYVNEADRDLAAAERDSFTVEGSVDAAYRKLFGRLQDCVSTYGYRVHGNISRERDAADVIVDAGAGFDRVLYLAESLFLKAELERLAPDRTRITFVLPDPNAKPFSNGAKRWLVTGDGPCRV